MKVSIEYWDDIEDEVKPSGKRSNLLMSNCKVRSWVYTLTSKSVCME